MGGIDQGSSASFRGRMHELLRSSILDAAWEAAATTRWNNVRMVDIADTVGVSRQTIYNEFGTKEDLAHALFARELAVFESGLSASIERANDLPEAARSALTWFLAEVRGHAVLQWMLRDARENNSEGSALPLLTFHADTYALPIREMLLAEFSRRWPGSDEPRAQMSIDFIIRWTITQVLFPSHFPEAEVIEGVVEMAATSLRMPPLNASGPGDADDRGASSDHRRSRR